MITIIKGKEKITCSYKTYDEQFRQLGYVLVPSEKKVTVKTEKTVEEAVEKVVEEVKEAVEEVKEAVSEEEKIGTKYGVRRRTTTKKED